MVTSLTARYPTKGPPLVSLVVPCLYLCTRARHPSLKPCLPTGPTATSYDPRTRWLIAYSLPTQPYSSTKKILMCIPQLLFVAGHAAVQVLL